MTFIQGSSLKNTGTDTELYPQGRDAFSWPSHGAYDENRQLLGTEEESSEVIADSRIMLHVGSWLAWWPHAFIRLEEVAMRKMKTRMCGWSQRSSTAITSHSLEPCRQIQEESYLAHRWPFSPDNFFSLVFSGEGVLWEVSFADPGAETDLAALWCDQGAFTCPLLDM